MGDGRTRLLVVLFTDMVNSTKLRGELGDDVADDAFMAHDEIMRSVIDCHEGTVVKTLGDGLMVWFPGASCAAQAAVALQRAAAGLRGATSALPIRVGLSVGDVVLRTDGDLYGSPVVEAARLCASATSGQILCSGLLGALVGTRGDLFFGPVVPLVLKGVASPVDTTSVTWDTEHRDALRLLIEGPGGMVHAVLQNGEEVTVGSSPDCDLFILGDRTVSRRHCQLNGDGVRWSVADLSSRNGTAVNGRHCEREMLHHGDRVQLGATTMEVIVERVARAERPGTEML